MKKVMIIAALTLVSGSAFASKARLSALGNAAHLIDTQTLFNNPGDINYNNDFATLEFGPTSPEQAGPATPHAEGGFERTMSFGKLGVYLGHTDPVASTLVTSANSFAGANTFLQEQNPLDVFYGTELGGLKWGFGVHYSNSKDDVTNQKEHTAGVSAGVRTDMWDAHLRLGLDGDSENTNTTDKDIKSSSYADIGGGYWFDTIYVYAKYLHAAAKANAAAVGADTNLTEDNYALGMVNNHKLDGGNFFYGLSYMSSQMKPDTATTTNTTVTSLPLLIGLELDAASWLVLRGSVQQPIFLSTNKVTTLGTVGTNTSMINSTTVAAGAGVKFNKWTLDATLAGAADNNGAVNGNTLFTNASLTYMF